MRLLFADDLAYLVFTDPPYDLQINEHIRTSSDQFEEFAEALGEMTVYEFTEFLRNYLVVANEVTRPGALIYSFVDWQNMREMFAAVSSVGLNQTSLCVWVKPKGGMGSFYWSRHEQVFVLRHPGAPHMNNVALGANGRNRTNVLEYAGATGGRADDVDGFFLLERSILSLLSRMKLSTRRQPGQRSSIRYLAAARRFWRRNAPSGAASVSKSPRPKWI